MLAERVELHGVPGQLDGRERQRLRVDLLPGGRGQRGGEPGVVEGRLADARRRVDQHEPLAGFIAHPVPETGPPSIHCGLTLSPTMSSPGRAGRRRSCSAA
jgi:hypothetical protein